MSFTSLDQATKLIFLLTSALLKILILIACTPFFIVFICPIYLIRILVQLASKVLRPDLVTILGVRDTFYAIDEITSPKSTVLQTFVLKGDFSTETVMKTWTRLLNETRTGGKDLKYPEFKRYLIKWMGFIFWKQDEDFSFENHIKYYDAKTSTSGFIGPSELKQIEKIVINEPFLPNHSPWEFKLVKNYQRQEQNCTAQEINENYAKNEIHTVLLFKVHHSFVDGLSLLNMFIKDIIQAPDSSYISQPNFPKRSIFQTAFLGIWLLFKTPYDTLSDILLDPDNNPWYLSKDRITNEINTALSPGISSQQIKDIAQGFQVSFTSTIIAAISGGIRMLMIDQGKNPDRANFSCLAPFPVPGRPETMGNYLSDCYVDFPIEISDPVQRIKHVEAQLHNLKHSTVPLSSFAVQPFFGGLFYWMLAPMVQFALSKSTGIVSIFPGPKKEIFWDGYPIVDAYFSAGHDTPGIGIQFLGFNYNGVWRLKIQADKGTLSTDSEVEKLMDYVVQELDSYYKTVLV